MGLETQPGGSEGMTDLQVDQVPPETSLYASATASADRSGDPGQEQESETAAALAELAESLAAGVGLDEIPPTDSDAGLPKRGDLCQGTIVEARTGELVVDIGASRQCVIAASDYEKLGSQVVAQLVEGASVTVYIIKPENREGRIVGSLYLAQLEADWNRAEEMERSGEIFEARVSGQNRGGLLVPFGHLRGFVPASHLVGNDSHEAQRPAVLSYWLDKTLAFKVIEVNRRRNRLILSYRAARRQWRSQQRKSLLEQIHEGDVRHGIVSSLASFGALVDLGGADGLIHISEMAWYRVEHPSEVLQVGQDVEVYVLRVDSDRGRIGLSLKRLQPDPWTLVEAKYQPGQLVEGTISKLMDFGAFAELEKGVEGLIHISEMAEPAPVRPEEIVTPGERRLLWVLRVDAAGRRIGLSLRAVMPDEVDQWESTHAPAAASSGSAGSENTPPPSTS